MPRVAGLMAMVMLTSGCGSSDDDGVGGVSASEARALNEAAAMLDARAGAAEDKSAGLNPAARMAAERQRGAQPAADPAQ
ncbi:MAG: hypothetical protein U9R77_03195 [Pseudomonadota bacterium]|uniref:hypothetical protein n=1 Tax=Sphingobium naphthae TaxID=1886786 RepID=UPI002B0FAEEC|nr:hypothetical protein [Pseudomonadota bacterium]